MWSDVETSSKEVGDWLGVPGAHSRSLMLQKEGKDSGKVELMQWFSPPLKPDAKPQRFGDVGILCVSFAVTDIEEMYKKLVKNGIKVIHPPTKISEIGEKGGIGAEKLSNVCGLICFDPDGIMVELIQY